MTNNEHVNTDNETVSDSNKVIINEVSTKISQSYLDPKILDIKKYSRDDLGQFTEIEIDKSFEKIEYSDIEMSFKEHDVVEGTVVAVSDKEVLIDIGFKSEGSISLLEFSDKPIIGDKVNVFITSFEDRKGNIVLSKEKADFQNRWKELRDSFDNNELITGDIIKRIKGGMIVELGVVQAFLPGSQLDIKPVTNFDEYIGKTSEFKIVKFNEFRQNIVVSRKAILSTENDEKRKELLENIKVGSVHSGLIKNITDFGAFIDLGGVDGLLHITDITWGRINHPTEKLNIGDTIDVKIIDFDEKTSRISLGTKQLTEDPWENATDRFDVGSVVEGKVVNLMNYGMFVEIQEGVEGLVHISEMSWTKHIKHPSDMFKMGDKIESKVLSINVDDKKISLGIKQLQDNPWNAIEDQYNVGDIHNCKIKNTVNNGVFLALDDNIEGFLHNSDISWTRKIKSISDFTSSDTLDVKILEVSSKDKKIVLSHKHLSDDPWENIENHIQLNETYKGKVLFKLDKSIVCLFNDIFEGVAHITNDNHSLVKDIKDNEEVSLSVTDINVEKRKLSLDFVGLDDSEHDSDKNEIVKDVSSDKSVEDADSSKDESADSNTSK